MITVGGIAIFVVLAFLLNKALVGSEILISILIVFVLFFCILHVYYVNNESGAHDLYTEDTRKMKKRQQLSDAFDAILNKNNSSTD